MSLGQLTVDGIPIADVALLRFSQTYQKDAQVYFARTADGAGVVRALGAERLRTRIEGTGWMPAGLQSLDLGEVHELGCVAPRDALSVSPSVALPAARRADAGHTPWGYAVVSGKLVDTTINAIVDDVADLAVVSGASHYLVYYLPLIDAAITRLENRTGSNATHTWVLEAAEV